MEVMTCEYDSPIPKQQAKKAALKLEVNLPYKVGGVSLHALWLLLARFSSACKEAHFPCVLEIEV